MDQLRETMSTLSVPEALEPWRVQPWKGVDGWESLEMRDGRDALIWEGPRGIDNEDAWIASGWRLEPVVSEGDPVDQACAVLVELVEANVAARDTMTGEPVKCQDEKWPIKRSYSLEWSTTQDGRSLEADATLRETGRADVFTFTVTVGE